LMMKVYETLLSGQKIWGSEKTIKILQLMTEMLLRTGEGQALEIEQRNRDLAEATMKWWQTLFRFWRMLSEKG